MKNCKDCLNSDVDDNDYPCRKCNGQHFININSVTPIKKSEKDNVNHPSHYTQGKFETIDIIEDITKEGFDSYLVGNILKYISRYKHKNGVEDLKKCRWYLDKLISKMEGK